VTQQPLTAPSRDLTLYSGPRHTGGWWAVAVLRVDGVRVATADVDAGDEGAAREMARAMVMRQGGDGR